MTQTQVQYAPGIDVGRLVEQLVDYGGPPESFLIEMLEAQSRSVGARAAAIISLEQGLKIVACYPRPAAGQTTPLWLAQSLEALGRAETLKSVKVLPIRHTDEMYGQAAREHVVSVPIRRRGMPRGAALFDFAHGDTAMLELAGAQLTWAVALISNYELRQTLVQRSAVINRLVGSQELLATINRQQHFHAAAMALCNEIAARWSADRVGLGMLHGRYVKLHAMSHTDKFTRKMRIVQDLEAAMEEVIDQDVEVAYPAGEQATYISRAAAELSRGHGPAAVLGLPMRYDGQAVAVLTLQRAAEKPFTLEEIQTLRLTCELCTARMVELQQRDQWLGAKLADRARQSLVWLIGAKHTWTKLAAVLILGFIGFVCIAKGTYRVQAPFVIESRQAQSIPAPFEGIVEEVFVKPGDPVVAGQTILALMRTDELEQQLNAARMEQRRYQREADMAMRQDQHGERQVAIAQADEIAAQIKLLEYRLAHAKVVSAVTGVVTRGELHQQAKPPVQRGSVMFEVAPIDQLRATLMVPEEQVIDLLEAERDGGPDGKKPALSGRLASAAEPGRYIRFEVDRISPVAEVLDQRNVFRVEASLIAAEDSSESISRLRPGMEGLAKVDIDRRRYAWIWSRELVNWIRMKLWL